jgi:site-specific DNA recombinase
LFTKNSLYALLTNVTYIGKIKYKDEVHDGEHERIVPDDLFAKAQTLLHRNGHTGGRAVRNKHGALLRGLLRCAPCGCAMSHTYTAKGNRRYRYYVCGTAQQRGWSENVPRHRSPLARSSGSLSSRSSALAGTPP